MQRVFLSADDFGRSPERNRAIDDSLKRGLIKSAGMIVTGRYMQDAIDYMKHGGYVGNIHCHFNLSGNFKNEDSEDTPLTNRMKQDRFFCSSNGQFRSYSGLPNNPLSVFRFIRVYSELVAQYNRFLEITEGKGNRTHIDFHLWYNLTWPVCIALNLFTWTHRIKSVRYIGYHLEHSKRVLFRVLSWNPFVKSYRSSNIDGFLSKPQSFKNEKAFELYCHPDYVNGELLDNSVSYYGHEKRPLEIQLSLLKQYDVVLVSWADE